MRAGQYGMQTASSLRQTGSGQVDKYLPAVHTTENTRVL
jgi:hypothetical protein